MPYVDSELPSILSVFFAYPSCFCLGFDRLSRKASSFFSTQPFISEPNVTAPAPFLPFLPFLPSTDSEIEACFDAFSVLRPHLLREEFLPQVRRQEAQGYRIVAIKVNERVCSVAGFRLAEFLAWGRILYIDDLSTLPDYRGRGHGAQLLDWLSRHALDQHCAAVHLDTGYARHTAHRLYLNQGFDMTSHHMAKALKPKPPL